MTSDHLDKETSLSAELTEAGIKASVKSRFVAALDRLGGALIDNVNARIEGSTERKRAKTQGEIVLIENIVEYGVQQLGASPEVAERAFKTHFKKVLIAQENKDHVLLEARKELEENPPSEDIGGDISDDFFARFEPHAEAASSDDLRQLFGRILAGEVRRPGTVSAAALHFAAMLDAETAALIEKFSHCVTNRVALTGLMKDVSYPEVVQLEVAGFWVAGQLWELKIPFNGDWHTQYFIDEKKVIALKPDADVVISIDAALLSRAGQEILECIGAGFTMFEEFARSAMATSHISEAHIGDLIRVGDELVPENFRVIHSA